MRTFSLQSGSNGNCIYVEADGVGVLFDAGISGIQALRRLARHRRDIRNVSAVIISHDHSDHVRCAGVYHRKFGLPLMMSRTTRQAADAQLGKVANVRCFTPGESLTIGPMTVHTLPTAHDAADGAAFVVEHGGKRLGILTDLGHPFDGLGRWIESLDAMYLESNYDPDMLQRGPYPPHLKARIRGDGGHLSNDEAAGLVGRHAGAGLQWVAMAHLSEENNRPELARQAYHRFVDRDLPIHLAWRYEPSEEFRID